MTDLWFRLIATVLAVAAFVAVVSLPASAERRNMATQNTAGQAGPTTAGTYLPPLAKDLQRDAI